MEAIIWLSSYLLFKGSQQFTTKALPGLLLRCLFPHIPLPGLVPFHNFVSVHDHSEAWGLIGKHLGCEIGTTPVQLGIELLRGDQ